MSDRNDGRDRSGKGRGKRNDNRDSRGRDGGRRGKGGGGRPRGGENRGHQDEPRVVSDAEMEFVLKTGEGCIAADVREDHLPLNWHETADSPLLKAGLYLRRAGSLTLISRNLDVDDAVLYALWEDPEMSYRTRDGRWVKPGVHACFLIKGGNDGPPWVPLGASIAPTAAANEQGLLSPWLDQVSPVRFDAQLRVAKRRLQVNAENPVEEATGSDALAELCLWLAERPEASDPLSAMARRMMVQNGHGLQRLGLSAMHRDVETRRRWLHEILCPLVPELAPLLRSLFSFWFDEGVETEAPSQRIAALALAMTEALDPKSPVGSAANLALLTTWISGLFGARPERENIQPARLLFWVARSLRANGRRPEAFMHPDFEVPQFPLTRATMEPVLRDLSSFPDNESDFERMLRALAVAESGWDIARPRMNHVRPFRTAAPKIEGYPIAARTFGGRYDYVISGWSFRGHEVRSKQADTRQLEKNLLLHSASVASVRAYARVMGGDPALRDAMADALSHTRHGMLGEVVEILRGDDDGVRAAYDKAMAQGNPTRRRVLHALAAAEYLITRAESGAELGDFVLRAPEVAGDGAGVAGHFMYWRTFCRSISERVADYPTFLESVLPQLDELAPKLQAEVFALLRTWLLRRAENRQEHSAWLEPLTERARAILDDADELSIFAGERLNTLLTAIAALDSDRFLELFEALVKAPGFELREIHRLIDIPRVCGWADEFRDNPLFTRLHPRLADTRSVFGMYGRSEWIKKAIAPAKKSFTVRWLLDARHQPRFTGSRELLNWFVDRGLHAVENPDAAVIELLELAVRLVEEPQIDVVVAQVRRATTWPEAEVYKMLRAEGRPAAALSFAAVENVGEAEELREDVTALLTEPITGVAVRDIGEAIRHIDSLDPAEAAALREQLLAALAGYEPAREALEGFALALDGIRRAELDLTSDALASIRDHAYTWCEDSRHPALLRFVYECGQLHTVAALSEALAAPGFEGLGEAISALEPAPFATRFTEVLDGASGGPRAKLARMLLAHRRLDGPLGRAVFRAAKAQALSAEKATYAQTALAVVPQDGDGASGAIRSSAAHVINAILEMWTHFAEDAEAETVWLEHFSRRRPAAIRSRRDLARRALARLEALDAVIEDPRRLMTSDMLDSIWADVDPRDVELLTDWLIDAAQRHDIKPVFRVERNGIGLELPKKAKAVLDATESVDEDATDSTERDGEESAAGATEPDDSTTEVTVDGTEAAAEARAEQADDADVDDAASETEESTDHDDSSEADDSPEENDSESHPADDSPEDNDSESQSSEKQIRFDRLFRDGLRAKGSDEMRIATFGTLSRALMVDTLKSLERDLDIGVQKIRGSNYVLVRWRTFG